MPDVEISCDEMVTVINIRGKRAFIFNPASLPCVVSIGDSQYYYHNLDDVRNSKNTGIFKEALLKLLTVGE
jgi:hypothetical protein